MSVGTAGVGNKFVSGLGKYFPFLSNFPLLIKFCSVHLGRASGASNKRRSVRHTR